MEFYTKRSNSKKIKAIFVIIIIFSMFYMGLYFFDKKVFPYVLELAELKAKSQTMRIINDNSNKILKEQFKYDEVVKIEKDSSGRVILLQADSAKLNYIATQLEDSCNKSLNEMDEEEIRIPVGWISQKSIFYNMGPKVSMNIQPVGNMIVTYDSKFEGAGINQTRHKIYLNISGKIRMILPITSREINIKTQIPVSDTVIVGDIPENSIYSAKN